jgi:hypothetical protein
MTAKQYRTAQGRIVDLGSLMLKNENVRAVGNLPVNAKGDYVDADNRPIHTKPKQVNRQYKKQITNVIDDDVISEPTSTVKPAKHARKIVNLEPQAMPDVPATATPEPAASLGSGGLAAAIARARTIQQEPMLDPRTQAKTSPGVTKI